MDTIALLGLIEQHGSTLINAVIQAWKDAGQPSAQEISQPERLVPPPRPPVQAGPGGA